MKTETVGRAAELATGVIFCTALVLSLQAQPPELTIREYFEMTAKSLELSEFQWKDRVSLAQSDQGAAKDLDAKLRSIDSQYDHLRDQLYEHYGQTMQSYLRYSATNRNSVSAFLKKNVEMKALLEDGNSRIRSLRQQMESIIAAKRGRK